MGDVILKAGIAQVLAPAKVNLRLQVTGRRADGYHLLDSWVAPIALFDDLVIVIEPGSPSEVTLRCEPPGGAPPGAANLAVRAAEIFVREANGNVRVGISLVKRIPVGAGLGGGSSDAAAVLRALNALAETPMPAPELRARALSLGADVPFFLLRTPARMRGIGERLERWDGPHERGLALVVGFAGLPLETRAVYAEYDRLLTSSEENSSLRRLRFGRKQPLRTMLHNDLEAAAFQIQPAVSSLKQRLSSLGAEGVVMTGSGSAVFGIWRRQDDAQAAARELRDAGIWAHATRMLRHVPAVRCGAEVERESDGRSPSGKAPDFGSGIEGSNPSRPA